MNNNIKTLKITRYWKTIVICLFTCTCLTSCEKLTSPKVEDSPQVYSVAIGTYKNKGLKIIHPANWSLLHDEPGIIADRTIAFETPEASRITVFFYKSEARSYSDLANSLEQQLNLRNSKTVKSFKRETVELGDYKGVKLGWTNVGLTDTKNEVTILQLQAEPYPVLVQFHLFDGDIETQKNNLVPFLQGVSFDLQRVNQ